MFRNTTDSFFAVLFAICSLTSLPAQTFKSLADFTGTNGSYPAPHGALAQGTDGNFYGSTFFGGISNSTCESGCGTIFKITPAGALTTVYSFCSEANCADGYFPSDLVLATDGNFYGVTALGGTNSGCTANNATGTCGTIFRIAPGGTLTTLYSFCSKSNCTDGYLPYSRLVQASNGYLYGTTFYGGTSSNCSYDGEAGCGTAFRISVDGAFKSLASFDGNNAGPTFAGLIQGTDGDLYGTSTYSGLPTGNNAGTIFRMTPGGKVTNLYTFCPTTPCTDGATPMDGMVQGTDGYFYGTTIFGGANSPPECSFGCGTIFKISSRGSFQSFYSFCSRANCPDGNSPTGLILATDGNFYGVAGGGGNTSCASDSGCGTFYQMTYGGALATLHDFCQSENCTDGASPQTLVLSTNGTFFGTTILGGTDYYDGTAFSLATGLAAFAQLETTSGEEGTEVSILGQGFSSKSVVEFGGTKATATTLTGTTFIAAIVPSGALTGSVTVTTGKTKLISSEAFDVLPTISSFGPSSGGAGTLVSINGSGLFQAIKVSFDGKPASFTVNSDVLITATVPTGAKTGKITVITDGGDVTSKTNFTVN